MEILCLVLFEHGHHEFELVLGHDDGGREVGFFSLSLGTALRVTGPRRNGAFSTSLSTVPVQSLLIALVHVVIGAMDNTKV